MKYKKGDVVTLRQPVEAYYSDYGGRPKCIIPPGTLGVVAKVNVPKVTRQGSFNCVDFVLEGQMWRVGTESSNLKPAGLKAYGSLLELRKAQLADAMYYLSMERVAMRLDTEKKRVQHERALRDYNAVVEELQREIALLNK